ncbi:extracellular solute-binding protein [Salinibacterium sp. GXW1014]|uniref:extracellular solute-binding protein n=1 Tax=Salinibacterium sp. GXW1014 TaxID=3377838 RepID=UPI00383BD1B3
MGTIHKTTALTALGVVAALTLAGCTAGAGASSSADAAPAFDPDKQYDIVFESYNLGNATWEPTILELIERFEAKYPNVSVTAQASGSDSTAAGGTAQSVQRQVLAGNAPDVVQMTFDTMAYAVSDLQAKPLDELFGTDAIDEHFGGEYPMHESVRDFGASGDHVYGIPYVLSTPMFYYNESALAEIGITDPDFSTWESVAEVAKQATAATGTPSLSVSCFDPVGEWCLQSIFRSNDARVLSEDGSTITVAAPEAIDALSGFQQMTADGTLQNADFMAQVETFAGGSTLMHVNSASMQKSFEGGASAGGWSLSAVGMPGFAGEEVIPTSSGSALLMFSQDADKQAAAWELLKFMTSEVAYEAISPLGYLPLRTGLIEEGAPLAEWAAGNSLLTPNLEQLDRLEPWVSFPGTNYVQVTTAIMDATEAIVYNGADAKSTLTEAAERAQGLISK